jgi:hypothetical protein
MDLQPLFLQTLSRDEAYRGMVTDHEGRHRVYCQMHGYHQEMPEVPEVPGDEPGGWWRLDLILQKLRTKRYSHVFWVDADVFVADLSRDMQETTPGDTWLGMTVAPYPWRNGEQWHLQCGMFYFRCCDESIAFLERVMSLRHEFADDQTAINRMLVGSVEASRWQRGLNVLPYHWNNTLHDQPEDPIVAAFHGHLAPPARRRYMADVAARYPFYQPKGEPMKVCLNMIVRNEEAVLPRSLRSFLKIKNLGWEPSYRIGDGGSTDRTVETIREVMMFDAPGDILLDPQPDPIDDFSKYRNHVIEASLKEGYLFFLDADDELVIEPGFNPDPPLEDDAYEMKLINGDVEWYRTVLVKAGLPWRYAQESHEALTLDGKEYPVTRLMGMHIQVHAGEGARSRGNKVGSDITSLLAAYSKDPTNSRIVFYLAQSYRDSEDFISALRTYAARVSMGDESEEEVYISLLEMARILTRFGEGTPQQVQEAFLRAWEIRPTRAEALGTLASYCRLQGDYIHALAFATMAAGIPFPEMDRLLVEKSWYEWRAWHELAEAALRCGRVEMAQQVAIDLLMNPRLPVDDRPHVQALLQEANKGRWAK